MSKITDKLIFDLIKQHYLSLPKTPSAWVAALTESEHDPGR